MEGREGCSKQSPSADWKEMVTLQTCGGEVSVLPACHLMRTVLSPVQSRCIEIAIDRAGSKQLVATRHRMVGEWRPTQVVERRVGPGSNFRRKNGRQIRRGGMT